MVSDTQGKAGVVPYLYEYNRDKTHARYLQKDINPLFGVVFNQTCRLELENSSYKILKLFFFSLGLCSFVCEQIKAGYNPPLSSLLGS